MRKFHVTAFLLLIILALAAGCTPIAGGASLSPAAETPTVELTTSNPTHTQAVLPAHTITPAPAATPSATSSAEAFPTPSESLIDGTVHSTGTFTGYFAELQYGDYMHVLIRAEDGEECWFWISSSCDTDFETLTIGQKMEVTWVNIDLYIYEPDKVINLDMITEVTLLD